MQDKALYFTVFNEIGIINQLTSTAFAAALPEGMTIAQFSVLNHFVRLNPGAKSPKDLASAFQVTRATMTSTLSRLERGGFVVIEPDPDDGRGKRVAITKKGRAMREECVTLLDGPISEAQGVIEPEAMEELLPLLVKLRQELDQLRN